jgi:hypothetical protein
VDRLVRPSALARFFLGTAELESIAAEVEAVVLAAISELGQTPANV